MKFRVGKFYTWPYGFIYQSFYTESDDPTQLVFIDDAHRIVRDMAAERLGPGVRLNRRVPVGLFDGYTDEGKPLGTTSIRFEHGALSDYFRYEDVENRGVFFFFYTRGVRVRDTTIKPYDGIFLMAPKILVRMNVYIEDRDCDRAGVITSLHFRDLYRAYVEKYQDRARELRGRLGPEWSHPMIRFNEYYVDILDCSSDWQGRAHLDLAMTIWLSGPPDPGFLVVAADDLDLVGYEFETLV